MQNSRWMQARKIPNLELKNTTFENMNLCGSSEENATGVKLLP
jgi:hypothetical protein